MTQFVYLSNALSGTISRYKLHQGELTLLGETEVGYMVMPMAVSPCQNYLYAAIHSEPFHLKQLRIDPQTGDLTLEGETPVNEGLVSLTTDKNNQWLLASSFDQHNVVAKPMTETGHFTDKTVTIQHSSACHTCLFSPDDKWMVATEFGVDKILVYPRPNSEGMVDKPVASYQFAKDAGPRHIAFSPCGAFLYVVTEMDATVVTLTFDSETGQLAFVAESPAIPREALGLERGLPPAQKVANDVPRVWAADIHITRNGRFIYVSERTLSVITCLEVDKDTHIPYYRHHHQVEKQPRSFIISPDDQYILASGELAGELGAYSIDANTGQLSKVSAAPCGEGAGWVSMTDYRLS